MSFSKDADSNIRTGVNLITYFEEYQNNKIKIINHLFVI